VGGGGGGGGGGLGGGGGGWGMGVWGGGGVGGVGTGVGVGVGVGVFGFFGRPRSLTKGCNRPRKTTLEILESLQHGKEGAQLMNMWGVSGLGPVPNRGGGRNFWRGASEEQGGFITPAGTGRPDEVGKGVAAAFDKKSSCEGMGDKADFAGKRLATGECM